MSAPGQKRIFLIPLVMSALASESGIWKSGKKGSYWPPGVRGGRGFRDGVYGPELASSSMFVGGIGAFVIGSVIAGDFPQVVE
jgi:hypothetical protein